MTLADGLVRSIAVRRGAPCDATWLAVEPVLLLDVDEAPTRYGLAVQLECKADPSGWDPIWGRSPVHFAGKVHRGALERALREALSDQEE